MMNNRGRFLKEADILHRTPRLITRRQFLVVASATAAMSARSAESLRRVGILMGGREDAVWTQAIKDNFRQLGWVERDNVAFEFRWGEGDPSRIRMNAAEIVKWKPEVILVRSATALREAIRAAGRIPIVFVSVSDPVGNGFVESLARPGRNVTGFSNLDYDMAGKWLQLLKEVAPDVQRVLALQSPNNPNWLGWMRAIDSYAAPIGLAVVRGNPTDRAQVEPALARFAREPRGGLLVLPDPFLAPLRNLVLVSAMRYQLPAIYGGAGFDNGEGLIYYGVDAADFARQAVLYASRILKGEDAGNLPVQAPTKFKLMVNLNVAGALGLTVPATIIARADAVVQ